MNVMSHSATQAERSGQRVSPAKLAHVVLRVKNLVRMRDWYKTVLQAEVTQESGPLCFLTYDDEHHRIALVELPDLVERDAVMRVGMDHIAFTYGSLADLLHTSE